MTMTTLTLTEHQSDSDLWHQVCQGSVAAFEILVRRYQSLVCAVAYNACADLALSEDVAQETFWTAWRDRAALEQPARLRAWLCGIARNLGQNARRRASRATASAPLDQVPDLAAGLPDPAEAAVSREEEALVWQTLEQIPDTYREPLILFYREDHSVADVAAALDLSEAAVKQRLSRGRDMLRERVAGLVEGTLRRSRPGRRFTVAVMTGLTTLLSAGAKTALAEGAKAGSAVVAQATLKAALGTSLGAGLLGGLLGSLGGLAGGWFGTWMSAQAAPTRRERDLILRSGRRMMLVSVLFVVALIVPALTLAATNPLFFWIWWAVWMVAFQAYIAVECIRLSREVKRLRADPAPTEPNDNPVRQFGQRWRGRVFRSRATLFGLPLLDINVADPMPAGETVGPQRGIARGWIAIGDEARGFIAIGGRSFGVLSFGGLAAGLVAVGGLSLGVLSLGGLGIGVLAFGGGAIGWQACGGGAVAWHAAVGGGAIAHDYALGGGAWAEHANDAAARAVLLHHPLWRGLEWSIAHATWLTMVFVVGLMLALGGMLPLMYRREQ